MRWRIIGVSGAAVVLAFGLAFGLLRAAMLENFSGVRELNQNALRAARVAQAGLALEASDCVAFALEQARTEAARGVFSASLEPARRTAATVAATGIVELAARSPSFDGRPPGLALFTTVDGVVLGRNGSELMRGEALGASYPALIAAAHAVQGASDLWVSPARQEQLLVCYAPVTNAEGVPMGVLAIGSAISDETLSKLSEETSGLELGIVSGSAARPIAATSSVFAEEGVRAAIEATQGQGRSTPVAGVEGRVFAAARLRSSGAEPVFVVSSATKLPDSAFDGVLLQLAGAAFLALFMIVAGGILLGNYISKPIAEMEDGLLLIINGRRDLRIDLEHDELGGLASRINALLNAILGVNEGPQQTSLPPDSLGERPPT